MVMLAPDLKAPSLLSVDDVSVAYGEGERRLGALDGVSLAVDMGEVVALVGPNGSGKTTLIRAVTSTVKLASGCVILAGKDVSTMRPREVAQMASVLPQEPVLPAAFTAIECVLMGRTPYLRLLQAEGPDDFEIVRRAMVATDTWRLADRLVGELSGGERQRVVLARALAQETPVLLLDEPTAHLDLGHQAAILTLVRKVAREQGKAVLAVVHDLTLASQCDRVAVLAEGRLAADGPPAEVISPEMVERVYGLPVHVLYHPVTGLPVVAPSFDQG
jgi:iron complex transport system ATP-binding protein